MTDPDPTDGGGAAGGPDPTDGRSSSLPSSLPSDPETPAQLRERNRMLLRTFLEDVLGGGDLALFDEIFHEEYELTARPTDETISDRDAQKEYYTRIRDRFSDLSIEVERVVADEGYAMAKSRVTGVHEKDYFGVSPARREVEFPMMSEAVVEDGRIVEQGDVVNPLRMQPPIKRHARSTLTDQIREGLVVVDEAGLVVEINAAAADLLDLEDRDVLNDPVESLFEPDVDVPGVGSATEVRLDDGKRILELLVTGLQGPEGDRIGRILSLRDVTDRVRRRQQLETLNRQNERLDRFVSIVSHDLRSPIEKAAGYVELARDTGDEEHFERLEATIERVDTMVEELLTVARTGTTVEDVDPVSFSHLVDDAWETAGGDGATLRTDLPVGAAVEGDPNLLRHVLENLFRNAVEHGSTNPPSNAREDAVEHGSGDDPAGSDTPSDPGEASVTVTVGTLEDGREGFYVAEDGPGIDPEDRETIFEYGYTGDGDGTGFGLTIVEQFVEAHGWDVTVTDGEAGGARFEVVTGESLVPG